jgi:hypothetical protein
MVGAAGRETVLVFGSPLPLDDCFAPVDATRSSVEPFALLPPLDAGELEA